jgi:hypothetical protein
MSSGGINLPGTFDEIQYDILFIETIAVNSVTQKFNAVLQRVINLETLSTTVYLRNDGNALPNAPNTLDLGSVGQTWRNLFLANEATLNSLGAINSINITLNNDLVPPTTDTVNLGAPTLEWLNVYASDVIAPTITTNILTSSLPQITAQKSIIPSITNTYDLGSLTSNWNNVYANNGYYSLLSTATLTSANAMITVGKNLIPMTTNTNDLGSTTIFWNNTYTNNLIANSASLGTITCSGPIVSIDTGKSVIPTTTNTNDLGSLTNRFNNIFGTNASLITADINTLTLAVLSSLTSTVSLDTEKDIIPVTTMTNDLGSSTNMFDNIYTNALYANASISTPLITSTGPTIQIDKSMIPTSDLTEDIGSTTLRWNNVYSNTTSANILASQNPAGLTTQTNLIPGTDATYTIGSPGMRWNDIYTMNMHILSDKRYKENIRCSSLGKDFVMSLMPVEYTYTTDTEKQNRFGLLAQDIIQELEKRGMDTENNGMVCNREGTYLVSYIDIIAVLIKALQEQQSDINKLSDQINGLTNQNKSIDFISL